MKKDLGAILFVSGTTIGAGMLALPTVTSPLGPLAALGLYIGIFALMLISAKYLVKLVLYYKHPHNFVGLARQTLGLKGEAVCWIVYLLLMYALVAAYISASSSMITSFIPLSESLIILLLPTLFALFLVFGLKGIDHLNRFFMTGLALSFVLLCFYLSQTAQLHFELKTNLSFLKIAMPIVLTSFGYHIIIPTLATYLDRNEKRINKALLIGSIIPLIVYILWHLLIYFNLTSTQLEQCRIEDIPITHILQMLHPGLSFIALSFSFFAIVTSFLGVALSLYDFLEVSLPKHNLLTDRKILFGLTFLPPLIYIFYFKKAFYMALDHAGILVALLLILLPALMYLKIDKKLTIGVLILILTSGYVILSDLLTTIL